MSEYTESVHEVDHPDVRGHHNDVWQTGFADSTQGIGDHCGNQLIARHDTRDLQARLGIGQVFHRQDHGDIVEAFGRHEFMVPHAAHRGIRRD